MARRTFTPVGRDVGKTPGSLRRHTCIRMAERFHHKPSISEIKKIEKRIRERDNAVFVIRQSASREVWMVNHCGVQMFFVYHTGFAALNTCLSREMTQNNFPSAVLPSESSI